MADVVVLVRLHVYFLIVRGAHRATLFPYTTLFRSLAQLGALTVGTLAGWRLIDAMVADEIQAGEDRKSTRLNSSHSQISYAVFCLKKKIDATHGHSRHPLGFVACSLDRRNRLLEVD